MDSSIRWTALFDGQLYSMDSSIRWTALFDGQLYSMDSSIRWTILHASADFLTNYHAEKSSNYVVRVASLYFERFFCLLQLHSHLFISYLYLIYFSRILVNMYFYSITTYLILFLIIFKLYTT